MSKIENSLLLFLVKSPIGKGPAKAANREGGRGGEGGMERGGGGVTGGFDFFVTFFLVMQGTQFLGLPEP